MKNIEIGQTVIYRNGKEYEYLGPASFPGSFKQTFSLRDPNARTGVTCDPSTVAPVEAIGEPNLKDPRIAATRDKAGRPGTWVGEWRIDTPNSRSWARTKRDGITEAALRLAIADWHNQP